MVAESQNHDGLKNRSAGQKDLKSRPTQPSGSEKHTAKSLARAVVETTASEWISILALIFGGCCSNAWTLELATTQLPSSGTLITFAQFVMTTLSCLPYFVYIPRSSSGLDCLPRLKPRKVPLSRWFVQVLFYFSTSLLNNMAFAYNIPMSVHIVFRSGGLVINMILGYLVQKRRYTFFQVLAVLLVTAGVISSTLYSSTSSSSSSSPNSSPNTYLTGVLYLFSALVLTGFMGLWQEKTFQLYGTSNWRESLFYSHLLSLPMFFLFRTRQLVDEIKLANQTVSYSISFFGVEFPSFYLPLVINVLTQLLCINGVNRLTSKVTSLTVTLVLVVRKAASLVISVVLVSKYHQNQLNPNVAAGGGLGLWIGASSVLIGTIMYSLAKPATTTSHQQQPNSISDKKGSYVFFV